MKLPAAFLIALLASPSMAADSAATSGCEAFTWDVKTELDAMRKPATPQTAATSSYAAVPALAIGVHYSVLLAAQGSVKFAAEPGRPSKGAAPHGGLLRFATSNAGRYRIAITSRHWIDVVADGKAIDSFAHEGKSGCDLLHKVVEFSLPKHAALVVQLSGQDDATVGLTISAVNPGK